MACMCRWVLREIRRDVRDGGAVLLDVGSGTDALTAAVAAAAPSGRIVGIDPAASYVAFAQTRHSGDRVRFEVGDAQQLRFTDASFDPTLSLRRPKWCRPTLSEIVRTHSMDVCFRTTAVLLENSLQQMRGRS
jgi:tRNA A58 N-methylase Trm61